LADKSGAVTGIQIQNGDFENRFLTFEAAGKKRNQTSLVTAALKESDFRLQFSIVGQFRSSENRILMNLMICLRSKTLLFIRSFSSNVV
jgi:hypothetical protein